MEETNLHSTMFLLIPLYSKITFFASLFTFHNVSINSSIRQGGGKQKKEFTFHNVSINSCRSHEGIRTKIAIYIPQCFY